MLCSFFGKSSSACHFLYQCFKYEKELSCWTQAKCTSKSVEDMWKNETCPCQLKQEVACANSEQNTYSIKYKLFDETEKEKEPTSIDNLALKRGIDW